MIKNQTIYQKSGKFAHEKILVPGKIPM